MKKGAELIDKAIVQRLSRRSNLWGTWLTLHVWSSMALAGAIFVIWPNIITFILAFTLIGSRQHGMAILMHDAAHGILFKNRKINDFVGAYLLAAPYGGDMQVYRKYHLIHHRHTQTPNDPDLPLSAKYPVSRASLGRKFLRDITGLTFWRIQKAKQALKKNGTTQVDGMDAFVKKGSLATLITNGGLFAILAAFGLWWAYFALWLLPLISWFWVVLRIRNIAEHALTEQSNNPLRHARTVKAGPIARIFLAPYWVNYHVEHHAFMYVPCYNLPKLHKAMIAQGLEPKMEIQPSYGRVLDMASSPAATLT